MVSSTTPDDQLYADKLKQLQKFVEPLRRMIARMENGNDTTNVAKLRNLLEVLVVPSKKVPLQALLKCETVLERLDLQMQAVPPSGSSVQRATVTTATAAVPVKEQQICQPLMDAILSLVNNPAFNHAAQRTFASPLQVLHGSNFVRSQSPSRQDLIPSPPPSQDVPHILQQEVALLGQRFSVTRDPTWATGSDDIHLVCSLEARNLPTVPPLNISIPSLYPDVSPVCHSLVDTSFVDDSSFLQTVYRNLHNQLVKMPDKYTLSSLLNAWELSVRSASHSQSVLGSAY